MKCAAAYVCRRRPIWRGVFVGAISEDAAQPFNLITLQENPQLNLMKNVLLAKSVRISTHL